MQIVRLTGYKLDQFNEECFGVRRKHFNVDDLFAEGVQHFFGVHKRVFLTILCKRC